MTDTKKRILHLIERYGSARAQEAIADSRDASMVTLKRHSDQIAKALNDIGEEIDKLLPVERPTSEEPADREIDPITYTDQMWVTRMIRRWLDEDPAKSKWTLTRGQLQGLLSVIDALSED